MSENQTKYYRGMLPSPMAPNSEKLSPAYGLKVAQAVFQTFMADDNSYYYRRNAEFKINRQFAAGKQPMKTYLDLLDIDEKESFIKLEYHPRPIAIKFRDILVNSIMEKVERVKCKGLSLEISERKEQKKLDAEFRMKEKDFISKIGGEAGVPFESEDDFTPSSKEELDLWSELNDEELEELLMSEGINFILTNNSWDDLIKKEIAESFVDTGMAFTKCSFDRGKRIVNKCIRPEQMVYGSTNSLTFDKVPYIGHVELMQVADIRIMFPGIKEEELYRMCNKKVGEYGNQGFISEWNNTFNTDHHRPYDGFLLQVLFYEYKATKYIGVLETKDSTGKKIIEYVKDNWGENGYAKDKKLTKQAIPAIYSGAWIVGSENVLTWGEQDDQLRSNEDVEDLSYSYDGYMLNNDGSMIPRSPISAMKSSIIQADLAILQLQHHMASIYPDGYNIDVDALIDVDMGAGLGKVGPMTLLKIMKQTGMNFFSGKTIKGDRRAPALEQNMHQIGDKLTQFMNVYNFEIDCLKDYIGLNSAKDGSGVNPRIGAQVMNNQIQSSNTATAHIYGGFIFLFGRVARGNGIRLWDTLKESSPNAMYLRILGKKNVNFIRKRKDITSSNYDVKVSIDMSDADRQFLEANIGLALQAGTIELEDAVFIRKLTNLDLAARYLTFMQKKRKKEAQAFELELQNNAQRNQGEIVAMQQQQQAESQAALDRIEMQKFEEKSKLEQFVQVQKGIFDALIKSMDPNSKAIPPYLQAIMDKQAADDQKRQMEEEQLAAQQSQMEEEAMEEQAGEVPMPV